MEKELLELLEKRGDAPLKEVLELRQALSGVRESIEQMSGQREHLSRLTDRAVDLGTMSEEDRLRRCGFQSSEFNWLLA